MGKRAKRLLLVMVALAVIDILGQLQLHGLLPEARSKTEQVTVYEHGKTLRLDSQLSLYSSLLQACELAVKGSSARSSAAGDVARSVKSGKQGDAIEIVYATPREITAGSRKIVVDHVFIPLTDVSKGQVTAFVGQGGYQEALGLTDGLTGARLNKVAAALATVQHHRLAAK